MPTILPFVYKTGGNLVTCLYSKEEQVGQEQPEQGEPPRKSGAESLDQKFFQFGEVSSAFVKEASAAGAVTYRGKPSALKVNVGMTKMVFSKWSIEIIMSTYSMKSLGFGDLKRLLNGISSRVLSKKLKDLEELGFIDREVLNTRPPKVRYTLSKRGEILAKLGEPVIMYLRQSMG